MRGNHHVLLESARADRRGDDPDDDGLCRDVEDVRGHDVSDVADAHGHVSTVYPDVHDVRRDVRSLGRRADDEVGRDVSDVCRFVPSHGRRHRLIYRRTKFVEPRLACIVVAGFGIRCTALVARSRA